MTVYTAASLALDATRKMAG